MERQIISKEWLMSQLEVNQSLQIIDCRFNLSNQNEGYQAYLNEHIPGAIYFDLEKDLSQPVTMHGGRHPLPTIEVFTSKLAEAGIDSTSIVIAYDDQGGAYAARLWWLLKYVGHHQVYILDEGFSGWVKAGYPITNEIKVTSKSSYIPNIQHHLLVDMSDVRKAMNSEVVTILDSREQARYQGLHEPIDKKAGHIPNASNAFWMESLDSNGKWKPTSEQRSRFQELEDPSQEIIVYCGSGVTACVNIVALMEAGFTNVKLYPGSFSDWISYEDNEIE